MTAPSDIPGVVDRLLSQYRRRLGIRAAVTGVLGLGCVAALVWRLHHLGLDWLRVSGIGSVSLSALSLWQWRVLKRRWVNRLEAALSLDRILGLEARLVTAVEFSAAPQPPALYPLLVQDPALALPGVSKHLPRLADRRTAILSAALLLLVCWPWPHRAPKQLAMRPASTWTPPEMPPPPDPSAPQPDQPQDQESGAEHAGGQGTSSQPQSSPDQQQGDPSSQSRGGSSQPQQGGDPDSSSSQQPSSQGPRQDKPDDSEGQAQPSSADHGASQRRDPDQAKGSQSKASQPQGNQQQSRGDRNASGQTPSESPGRDEQGNRSGGQAGSQIAASAQQEALKGDIQQLLKELSTELKQLQAQLEASQPPQPNPAPGTATDSNLYEDATRLETSTGKALPLQLDVDAQPTSRTRRGGGVGEPSGQVGEAAPQQAPESVDLADETVDVQASDRRAIPPEYRPVFERLSQKQ